MLLHVLQMGPGTQQGPSELSCFLFHLSGAGDGTQGLVLAEQALHR